MDPKAAMPPEMQAPGADNEAKEAPNKSPKELLVGAHDYLMQLMDMVSQSQAFPQEEKQELGAIISALQNFGEKAGQPAGAQAPQAPMPKGGVVSPETGGNPNAKPVM